MFDDEGALDKLEAFVSLNGPAFYGLPVDEDAITLERGERGADTLLSVGNEELLPFDTGKALGWRIAG